MHTPNFRGLIQATRTGIVKHSPEILTGIGIAGMIATTVMAVRATPKAILLLELAEEGKNQLAEKDEYEELTVKETVKTAWKCYIPAAVVGTVSAACLIGACSVNTRNARRNAALAAAYTLSENAFREYREKVVETIGEKKEQTVKDKVAEERIKNNPISKNEVFVTEKGKTRFYDPTSGRYFTSDINTIKKIQNELNHRLINEMYLSLNEFYDELGLSHTSIGNQVGWTSDRLIDIGFSAQLCDDEEPCIALDYYVAPEHDFDRIS